MLTIVIGEQELFDEEKNEFSFAEGMKLVFEHSLLSLSKWESKFQKPFLSKDEKTSEEVLAYIEAMLLTPDVSTEVLEGLSAENLKTINAYIESKESATTFGMMPERKGRGETITSELIYYWLVTFNIPFECETWHLNRLFSLIQICNIKNQKPKPMSRSQIAQRNRDLNAARRRELNSSG